MLKIYELPKIYNKINKILSTTSRNNNHLPGHFYFPTSSGFGTILLLTLLEMWTKEKRTILALN